MKKNVVLLFAVILSVSSQAQTKKFTGNFFEIRYPASFKMKDCPVPAQCDAVSFLSPDKTVAFFIFSPQWNGDPGMEATSSEKEDNRKVTEKNGVTITEVTLSAKNGSYSRSFIDYENKELNTRHTFCVKYKNMSAYNKYKKQYLAFKASLVQFAD
jgi:hypothetical protein